MARAQEVAVPAVSMSEKLKDHQKSLLRGKYHVTYSNLYWGTWQRHESSPQCQNHGKMETHKILNAIDVMQHMLITDAEEDKAV